MHLELQTIFLLEGSLEEYRVSIKERLLVPETGRAWSTYSLQSDLKVEPKRSGAENVGVWGVAPETVDATPILQSNYGYFEAIRIVYPMLVGNILNYKLLVLHMKHSSEYCKKLKN